jgi:hypothetical protein
LGSLTLHQQDSGSTVGDLRSITGSGGTGGGEGRLQFGKALNSRLGTNAFVLVNNNGLGVLAILIQDGDGTGEDLLLEVTGLLGSGSLLVRLGREGILLSTSETVVSSNVF